ncbi:MAG: hypothetical protein WAN65_06705 [Candidatus Sulfotelmatobacter sp.]
MRMLEESLRRLQTDHLDVWQIHEVVYENEKLGEPMHRLRLDLAAIIWVKRRVSRDIKTQKSI